MEEYTLTLKEIEKINSYFPDDKPLFVVDGDEFREASSDWKERLETKAIERGIVMNQFEKNEKYVNDIRDTEILTVDIVSGLNPEFVIANTDDELYKFFLTIYSHTYNEYYEHFTIFNIGQFASMSEQDVRHNIVELLDRGFITVQQKG